MNTHPPSRGFQNQTTHQLSINNADEALNPSRKWPLAAFHPERYLDKGTTDGLQYAVSTFGHGFHGTHQRG